MAEHVTEMVDPETYREASFQHAESHDQAGTDFEECDVDDCPHWPQWWVRLGSEEPNVVRVIDDPDEEAAALERFRPLP